MFKIRIISDVENCKVFYYDNLREAYYDAHGLVRYYTNEENYTNANNATAYIFANDELVGILVSASYNRGIQFIPANA